MTLRTWADLPQISPDHAELLDRSAVTPEVAERQGVRSILSVDQLPEPFEWAGTGAVPSLLFPWRTPSGVELDQLRLDMPLLLDGEPARYLWPKGCGSPIGIVREDPDEDSPVIFVEGTKQALAAAGCVDSGSVYAIAGCRSWSHDGVPVADLDVVEDRKVVAIFDADVETNPDVWEAARKFGRALEAEGAQDVRYVLLPAGGKAGLDDVLGDRKPEKRAAYVRRLLDGAVAKLPKKPAAKKKDAVSLGSASRPPIDVADDRLNVINNITACLRNRWDSTELFNFGGVLARRDGAVMEPIVPGVFVDLVQQVATTVTINTKGEMVYAEPTATSMSAALSRARSYSRLDRLALIPFVRADGTICQDEGYDEATATYLVESLPVAVPEDPTEDDISQARKLLTDEWLGDLMESLPSDADKANALALILTPLIRGLVPVAPLAVVNGLQMGVGKNLLGDMVAIFATGNTVLPLPWADDDDERRKSLLAAFRTGRELFVFDEAHVVEGAALARALTAATYTDRVLGVSNTAEFPNNVTWMSLGNNVQINGDMSRRVYVIRLEPTEANPQDRDVDSFRHPDLKGWTIEHRAELVAAGLTLVRAWFLAGRPQSRAGRRFGSFEAWGGMIGGVLEVAGVPGFLGNLQEWRSESDYDTRYWVDHFRWLGERWGPADDFTVSEVHTRMRTSNHVEHPPRLEDHEATGYGRALGQAYGKVKGRAYAGLRLVLSSSSASHGNRWRLEVNGEGEGDGASPPVTPSGEPSPSTEQESDEPGCTSGGSGGSGGIAEPSRTGKSSLRDDHARAHVRVEPEGLGASPLIPPIPPPNRTDPIYNGSEQDTIVSAPAGQTLQQLPDPAASPIASLLDLASAPAPDTCPECEGQRELVPPNRFWLACRRCHPGTFDRATIRP